MTDLEQLLLTAAQDAAAEPAFTAALLDAEVWVLGEVEGDQIALSTWEDADGPLVPFLTSEDMVQASLATDPQMPSDVLVLPCRELWQMVSPTRLVLNPNGPVARVYLAAEVAALLAGIDPRTGTEVSYDGLDLEVSEVGADAAGLTAELVRFFGTRPDIRAAHLAWVSASDGHAGYLLFVVTSEPERALVGLQDLDLQHLLAGETFDVTAIAVGVDDHLLAGIEPIHVAS